MIPQKIIIKKIEFPNIYYSTNPWLFNKKTPNKTYNHPLLIPKIHTIRVPTVFIYVIDHKDLHFFPTHVFICFVFIIKCGLTTINKTGPQYARWVRRVRPMLPPTTDE